MDVIEKMKFGPLFQWLDGTHFFVLPWNSDKGCNCPHFCHFLIPITGSGQPRPEQTYYMAYYLPIQGITLPLRIKACKVFPVFPQGLQSPFALSCVLLERFQFGICTFSTPLSFPFFPSSSLLSHWPSLLLVRFMVSQFPSPSVSALPSSTVHCMRAWPRAPLRELLIRFPEFAVHR